MWMSNAVRVLRRRTLVPLAVAGLLLIAAPAVLADGNGATTFTQTVHNVTQTFPNTNPCTGVPGTLSITYNAVFHYTVNKAGDFWDTFNETGDFSFVPTDVAQPSYTGHFHMWFGDSFNNQNQVDHFTFQVIGTGSDGSTLTFHEVGHFSVSASGIVQTFDKMSCG